MSNDDMIMHDPDNILEVSHLKNTFQLKAASLAAQQVM